MEAVFEAVWRLTWDHFDEQDEAENDGGGNITFASGELSSFMKGTKSIADAEEAYTGATMDAKTSRIRANNESEKALLDGAKSGAAKKKGQKAAKKAKKKGKSGGEKEMTDEPEGDSV